MQTGLGIRSNFKKPGPYHCLKSPKKDPFRHGVNSEPWEKEAVFVSFKHGS